MLSFCWQAAAQEVTPLRAPRDPEKPMICTMLQFPAYPTGPGHALQPKFSPRLSIGAKACSTFTTFDANHREEPVVSAILLAPGCVKLKLLSPHSYLFKILLCSLKQLSSAYPVCKASPKSRDVVI